MKTLEMNYTSNSNKIFDTGIYSRLSREDEETTAVSQSIINQKDFLTEYAVENGFNIIDYYIDDGYSGTTFDRPDFIRLIADIEKGRINTVITKDLSRLGRDYIMTGHYIEKYFPSKDVRYIAVNDGIDTYTGDNDDITPFKSVINDMYAKDISKKTRTAFMTKKLKGEFIGSQAPYGYVKDETNKNKLVINEETAVIVRRIFRMFIETQSVMGIMKQLTSEMIPTPSASKNMKQTQKGNCKGFWNAAIIYRMLSNPTYIGNLTQNRMKKVSYKVNKLNMLSKDQWITIPNTHEAIVSEDDFNTVQSLLSKRNYIKSKKAVQRVHLLTGLVFCADCKRPMTFMTKGKGQNTVYVICSTRKKYGNLSQCSPGRIREDYLQKYLIEKVQEIANTYLDKSELVKNADTNKQTEYITDLNKEKSEIQKQIDEIKTYILNLYKDKVKNIVSENNFIQLSNEFNSQNDRLTKRLSEIDNEINRDEESKDNILSFEKVLNEFLQFENIDRVTLTALINRIEVYRDKKISIQFNFIEP